MGKKKYLTEEERLEAKKERRRQESKRYREKHKDIIKQKKKEYRDRNIDIIKKKQKEYRENNKDIISEKQKQYRLKHREKLIEYGKVYRVDNSEILKEKSKLKNKSLSGRAKRLSNGYKTKDKLRGFLIEDNISTEWIKNNIFTSKCIYCGREGWEYLGADRIDNDKPHTPDNVVCACGLCNIERKWKKMNVNDFIQYKQFHPTLVLGPLEKNEDGSIKKRGYIKV